MSSTTSTYRNFANVLRSGSSARILNLLAPTLQLSEAEIGGGKYFFQTAGLNYTFILKHRLRSYEADVFNDKRTIGTKIFVPFDTSDLRIGGKYIFINEIGADAAYSDHFGLHISNEHDAADIANHDIRLLEILEDLPSLDPFILRERLRMFGFDPDAAYFEINDFEFNEMKDAIEKAFAPLIAAAFKGMPLDGRLSRFVEKLWYADDVSEMGPFLGTMQISADDYAETIFAWKGFIYYQCTLGNIGRDFSQLLTAIENSNIIDISGSPVGILIEGLRGATISGLRRDMKKTMASIKNYQDAYFEAMIYDEKPLMFREFLRDAPKQFQSLGASLGMMRHAVTFWRYRFGALKPASCTAQDFLEIMRDFAQGVTDDPDNTIDNLLREAELVGE